MPYSKVLLLRTSLLAVAESVDHLQVAGANGEHLPSVKRRSWKMAGKSCGDLLISGIV